MEELALLTIIITFACQTSWQTEELKKQQEDEKACSKFLSILR